jgi:HSP20 family protein
MNHKTYRNRERRNHVVFPQFTNMINEIMNTPIHSAVKDKVQTTPAVNVKQDEKQYTIEMSLPGYNKEDINIAIMDGKLVINSEVEKSTEDTYRLKEFSYGAFIRSFNLPKDANQEDISAKVANGILHLTIGKTPEATPKNIVIK